MIDVFSVLQRRQNEGRSMPAAVALAAADVSGLTKLYEAVIGRDTHDGRELTDQERYERGVQAIHELTTTAIIVRSGFLWLDSATGGGLSNRLTFNGNHKLIGDTSLEDGVGANAPRARRLVYGANWGIARSLAVWTLPVEQFGTLEAMIHEAARAVGDFGDIEYADVSTNPDGEEDEGFGWSGPAHRFDPMVAWVRAHADAVRYLSFDIGVEVPGMASVLHGASSLVLRKRDGKWHMTLSLHTNAYSPVARPGRHDNSEINRVLGPRLRAMMARASSAFGSQWKLVDATGYTDLVDDGGFLLAP